MKKFANKWFKLNVGRNKVGELAFCLWLKPVQGIPIVVPAADPQELGDVDVIGFVGHEGGAIDDKGSFGLFEPPGEEVCDRGHQGCLGPEVAANQGGCRMGTWSDVG
jgi:hypothetical protein